MTNPLKPQKSKEFLESRHVMADYTVMLSVLSLISIIIYGWKAAAIIAVSVLTCALCRKIGSLIFKNGEPMGNFSTIVTGLSIALLLPVSAEWWMPVCAGAFAIIVCVWPFGTSRKSPFVPTAAAICFLSVCFGDKLFLYPELNHDSYFGVKDAGLSITKMLAQNNSIGRNGASLMEVLSGSLPSAMGAGCVIALVGALIYFIIRRPKNAVPALTFILAAGLVAVIFPRVSTGRLVSVIMELSGGMLLFSAIFFMTYPSVMPKRLLPRALWGFAGGLICMFTRYFGFLEESVCFAILIIDALSEFFDKIPLTKREKQKLIPEEIIEEEAPATVVPEEILNEIPDVPEEATEEVDAQDEQDVTAESESLDAVISEENTVTQTEAPFPTGGDGDE